MFIGFTGFMMGAFLRNKMLWLLGHCEPIMYQSGFWVPMLWIPISAGMMTTNREMCFGGASVVVKMNAFSRKTFRSFGVYFMRCSSLYSFEEIP